MIVDSAAPDLDVDGTCFVPGLAAPLLADFEHVLAEVPQRQAGVRLVGQSGLDNLLNSSGPVGARVAQILGPSARAVRAILFDKSDGRNWALGWHQDRTIAVMRQYDVSGFGPWSIKQGIQHVEPPFEVIEAMITARIHLDPVDSNNAPLMVAFGSHRFGRIAVSDVESILSRSAVGTCLADPGDVWFYRTPILHASARSGASGQRRRVLQVDYTVQDLPDDLEWLGI